MDRVYVGQCKVRDRAERQAWHAALRRPELADYDVRTTAVTART
jgi:hypothetical protein